MAASTPKSTPRFDAWRERLRQALSSRGKKSDLARFMAEERGQSVHACRVWISSILREERSLHAETLLTISEWMDAQPNDARGRNISKKRTA